MRRITQNIFSEFTGGTENPSEMAKKAGIKREKAGLKHRFRESKELTTVKMQNFDKEIEKPSPGRRWQKSLIFDG